MLLSITLLLTNEIPCEIRLHGVNTEHHVVATQLNIIKSWEKAIQEAVRNADEYMVMIEKYCKLKEKSNGLLGSFFLSDEDSYNMDMLRNKLGGDFDINAKHVVWELTTKLKQSLLEILQPLKISLYDWNIDEMKRQQKLFTVDSVKGNIEKKVERWKGELIRLQTAVGRNTWNSLMRFVRKFIEAFLHKAVPLLANKAQWKLLS